MRNWILFFVGIALVAAIVVFIVLYTMPENKAKEKSTGIPVGGIAPGAPEGSVDESFLGMKKVPGIRNNNPGNIKLTTIDWQGKILNENNNSGTFEQFKSFPYGVRAMIKNLTTYINRDQKNTVQKIIDSWDRPGNTSYINFVTANTGFAPNQQLTPDKETMRKLTKAIARFECGEWILTDARFEAGYSLL